MRIIRDWYLEGYSLGLNNPHDSAWDIPLRQWSEAVGNQGLAYHEGTIALDPDPTSAMRAFIRGVNDALSGRPLR